MKGNKIFYNERPYIYAIAGLAVGAAVTGMRPVGEIQFMDFVTLSMEQLVLQGAKMRYMFGGKAHVSMVLRLPAGSGTGAAAQHSQSLEALFMNIPGLKIVFPSTAYDAKGLLLAAMADNNPIMFVEHKLLYKNKGSVPEAPYIVPLGKADIKRQGKDLTIVATGLMVSRAVDAATRLEQSGISAEIIDPRTVSPIDWDTIFASVDKTGRALIVNEATLTCSVASEIAATIGEKRFNSLDGPVRRIGSPFVPKPSTPGLEKLAYPSTDEIFRTAVAMLPRKRNN